MNSRSLPSACKNYVQLAGELPNAGDLASNALCVAQIKEASENLCEE
jgi:hypothetical protein